MHKPAMQKTIRILFPFVLALCLACLSTGAFAQATVRVLTSTGVDDLRGGNRAFITLVLTNGTLLPERVLSTGLGSNSSNVSSQITFPVTTPVTAAQIRSIRIRHDGSPRSGNPFDTYDNWDLKALQVRLETAPTAPTILLYNSANDSRVSGLVTRFTGDLRQIDLPIRAIGSEPDFTITGMTRTPGGLDARISNIGPGHGRVTNVTCSAFGRTISSTLNTVLNAGANTSIHVNLATSPGQRVTCALIGVDSAGRPEVVTTNNSFTRSF